MLGREIIRRLEHSEEFSEPHTGQNVWRANGVRPLQKGAAPYALYQNAGFADAPTSVLKTKPPLRLASADTRRCRPDEISETEKGSLSFHVPTMYQ